MCVYVSIVLGYVFITSPALILQFLYSQQFVATEFFFT